jgi:hypothetical protein
MHKHLKRGDVMSTRRPASTAWLWPILVGGLVAGTAAGCSDSTDNDSRTSATTAVASTPPATEVGYVARVNALCEELIPKVLAVNGGKQPTLERFEIERPKLKALNKAFDAQVDAIPITSAERAAAKAFDAFRRQSDAADAQLAAAAAAGNKETFDAVDAASRRTFENSMALSDLDAAGITCGAR